MKITLTRALVELKTLDARINAALGGTNFCFTTKGRGDKRVPNGVSMTLQALEYRIKGEVQAMDDLIRRRDTIKARLVEANAATTVLIAGKPYTIAGAIEAKRGVERKNQLLNTMVTQLARAEQTVQMGNAKLNDDIEKAVSEAFKGDKTKPTAEMYDSVANPRKDNQELALLDPVNVRNRIDALKTELVTFLADVDVALSEVNAKTEIEVE